MSEMSSLPQALRVDADVDVDESADDVCLLHERSSSGASQSLKANPRRCSGGWWRRQCAVSGAFLLGALSALLGCWMLGHGPSPLPPRQVLAVSPAAWAHAAAAADIANLTVAAPSSTGYAGFAAPSFSSSSSSSTPFSSEICPRATTAAPPVDPVLSSLPCLSACSGLLLSEAELDVLNGPVFAELEAALEPRLCPWKGGEVRLLPVSFAIPRENIVSCPTVKYRDYAQVIAGRLPTYTFMARDEAEYTHAYRIARFAHTKKKGGWDCARHWEILAAGSVPFFEDIEQCPRHTLAQLPKSLLLEARHFPGTSFDSASDALRIDHSAFNDSAYSILQQRLLHFARHRGTTETLARYILNAANRTAESVKEVLVLGCWDGTNPSAASDYMDDLVTHGFVRVLGERAVVQAAHPSLYRWVEDERVLPYTVANAETVMSGVPYGLGFFYGRRLYDERHRLEQSRTWYLSTDGGQELRADIARRRFDVVVFSCMHVARPHYDLVMEHYAQHEVLAIDGQDDVQDRAGSRKDLAQRVTLFKREIKDDCNAIS